MGKQLLRSGTSVGTHHREATRVRLTAEFVGKIAGRHRELEETSYCLELPGESDRIQPEFLAGLVSEADELSATFTTCIRNARENKK